jgi:hypothetical protein
VHGGERRRFVVVEAVGVLETERALRARRAGAGWGDEYEFGIPGRREHHQPAIVQNDGTAPVHLGDVTNPANPYQAHNDFEWSACHMHYHFSHYGTSTTNLAERFLATRVARHEVQLPRRYPDARRDHGS